MECGVCFRLYKDEGDQRPRSLSCGHSFCTLCVCSIIKENGLICPTCRMSHGVFSLDQVAINYGLIDILKIVGTPEEAIDDDTTSRKRSHSPSIVECQTPVPEDSCSEHGELWQYRCVPCDKWMCSKCLVAQHLDKGCRVISSKQALEELLQTQTAVGATSLQFYDMKLVKLAQYESLLEFHLQKQESLLKGLMELTERHNHVMRRVREEREKLQAVIEDGKVRRSVLYFALERTQRADNQRDFSSLLKEIRKLDVSLANWAKEVAGEFEESDTQNISLRQLVLGTAALRLMHEADQPDFSDEDKELKEGIYAVMEGDEGDVRSARVSMSGGHVLLHALEEGPPPVYANKLQYTSVRHLTALNTPVCFLSLSKNDTYFGRIYIRIISPSKRSYQFRLLCTGERGPCYKGSSFFSVQKSGEPGECLLGGDYNQGDGRGGRPLLEGIKPGPEYREIVDEGLVSGSNGDHSALFGIFLRSWSGVSDTAFAKVIKNLNLIQEAVTSLRDIRQLKVSDCGVVIPI